MTLRQELLRIKSTLQELEWVSGCFLTNLLCKARGKGMEGAALSSPDARCSLFALKYAFPRRHQPKSKSIASAFPSLTLSSPSKS